MKNEAVIERLKELGWDTEPEITLNIHVEKWGLIESSRYVGEWEGNGFVTYAQTNWKRGIVESVMSGEEVIQLLGSEDVGQMSSDSFPMSYVIDGEDGNMDCLDTQWETPLSDEDVERLSDSEDDVFSLAISEEHEPDFEVGSVWKLVIKVGNKEIDING
jgi:hypothetical protein